MGRRCWGNCRRMLGRRKAREVEGGEDLAAWV
jgi:hypothetical protein